MLLPADLLHLIEDTVQDGVWPKGLASEVIAVLYADFQPRDAMTAIEASKALSKLTMGATERPSDFLTKLNKLKKHYGKAGRITDEQIRTALISKCPSQYQSQLVTTLTINEEATTKELAQAMNAVYRMYRTNDNSQIDDTATETGETTPVGLSAVNAATITRCEACQQIGHTKEDCPLLKSLLEQVGMGNRYPRTGGRFSGQCHHCGMRGHRVANCWHKANNAALRPAGFRHIEGLTETALEPQGTTTQGEQAGLVTFALCAVANKQVSNLLDVQEAYKSETTVNVPDQQTEANQEKKEMATATSNHVIHPKLRRWSDSTSTSSSSSASTGSEHPASDEENSTASDATMGSIEANWSAALNAEEIENGCPLESDSPLTLIQQPYGENNNGYTTTVYPNNTSNQWTMALTGEGLLSFETEETATTVGLNMEEMDEDNLSNQEGEESNTHIIPSESLQSFVKWTEKNLSDNRGEMEEDDQEKDTYALTFTNEEMTWKWNESPNPTEDMDTSNQAPCHRSSSWTTTSDNVDTDEIIELIRFSFKRRSQEKLFSLNTQSFTYLHL